MRTEPNPVCAADGATVDPTDTRRGMAVRIATAIIVVSVALMGMLHPVSAAWPDKPVKLIVFSGAGGSPDATARLLAEQLTRTWGQNFYIENKVGAGGVTGLSALKSSAPDGYNFGLAPASSIVITPHVFKNVPFDIQNDFVPVAFVGASPIVVAVKADSPFRTFADLLAKAKSTPTPMAIGTPLTNTLPHLLAGLLKQKAGANMDVIPFSTSPQGVTALLRGDIAAMIDGYPTFEGMLQAGEVRLLANFDAKRSATTGDLPVVAETLPGVVATGWFAIFAPKGTPQPIIEKLRSGIDEALKQPELLDRLKAITVIPQPMTASELADFLIKERSFWADAIDKAGVKSN
jgi:tripartite-type tricarboxylate transporter receptor subunit TctC